MSRFLILSLLALAASPAFGAGKGQTVHIKNFAFVPAALTVAPGTTVIWVNDDEDPHTVTANGKAFHSAALDGGGRYSFTFAKAGDYPYFCSLHPHMTAKIVVK